jgi:hypothetical protein
VGVEGDAMTKPAPAAPAPHIHVWHRGKCICGQDQMEYYDAAPAPDADDAIRTRVTGYYARSQPDAVPCSSILVTAVNRFLAWPLPKTFAPDCGISFDGRKPDQWNPVRQWPVGTNLFTAIEAREMFEHCVADALAAQAREIAELREQLSKANIDAANLMAECSDMSVDIEKYRSEITEARAARDEAQRAGVTTANYWMERAEAERDKLREVLVELIESHDSYKRAAPPLDGPLPQEWSRWQNAWRAARAKVKP